MEETNTMNGLLDRRFFARYIRLTAVREKADADMP
jgi:hypothetical protein